MTPGDQAQEPGERKRQVTKPAEATGRSCDKGAGFGIMPHCGLMTNSRDARFAVDTRLVKIGAALTSAGMLLATAGMGLVSVAVTRAAREWMRQREISPAAVAAAKLHQARSASVAGVHAWHDYSDDGAHGVTTRQR